MRKLWILTLALLMGCTTRTIYVDSPKPIINESWLQTCIIERPLPLDQWEILTYQERIDALTIQLIKQIKHTTTCNARLTNIKNWKDSE